MRVSLAVFILALGFIVASPVTAMTGPEEKMSDSELEQRATALYYEVRCPVCDSQSIAESNAGISKSLRAYIRKSLLAGDSDEAIIAGLRESYGDDIAMTPPVNDATLGLWLAPFVLLLLGGIAVLVVIRRAGKT